MFEFFNYDAELEMAVNTLSAEGFKDAAREIETLRVLLKRYEVILETRIDLVRGLLHAVEWYLSCDYGKDTLKEEVEKWRSPQPR